MFTSNVFGLSRLLANKMLQFWLWISAATILLGTFLILTAEIRETLQGKSELVGMIDQWPLGILEGLRSPRLTAVAIDITALGSVTVTSAFLFICIYLLILKRLYTVATHLLFAGIGAAILSWSLKSFFERPRPEGLIHLVEAQGYSYPSGHSLGSAAIYFTFAIIVSSSFRAWWEKISVVILAMLFIFTIAISRVYLGVHYLSDVASGMLLGIGWAALLGAIRIFYELKSCAS